MTGNPERVQLPTGADKPSSVGKPQVEFDLREVMKPHVNSTQSKVVTEKHAQSLTDQIFGTLQILTHDAEVKEAAARRVASVVGHQSLLFAEAVVTGAVLNPINGTTEFMNHIVHAHIGELQFKNQKEVEDSVAGKIGETVGAVADYAALSLATGGLAGAIGLTGIAADMFSIGAAGALSGGILSPSGDTDSDKEFFEDRGKGLLLGGASSLLGLAAGGLLSKVSAPIENALFRRTVAIGGGAALGGAMSAGATELTALAFTGNRADSSDLIWSTSIGAFAGAVSSIPHSDLDIDEAAERQPSRIQLVARTAQEQLTPGTASGHTSSEQMSSGSKTSERVNAERTASGHTPSEHKSSDRTRKEQ